MGIGRNDRPRSSGFDNLAVPQELQGPPGAVSDRGSVCSSPRLPGEKRLTLMRHLGPPLSGDVDMGEE